MAVTGREIKELLGEHEGLRAHMKSLIKSREKMAAQNVLVKDRLWFYRHGLYDFRDAVRYHQELDERIFKLLPSDVFQKDPLEEHGEIQEVINEVIALSENTLVDKLQQEELDEFASKIGVAINKIYELIEIHIIQENAILEKALKLI